MAVAKALEKINKLLSDTRDHVPSGVAKLRLSEPSCGLRPSEARSPRNRLQPSFIPLNSQISIIPNTTSGLRKDVRLEYNAMTKTETRGPVFGFFWQPSVQ
jgi:hypothetical protein